MKVRWILLCLPALLCWSHWPCAALAQGAPGENQITANGAAAVTLARALSLIFERNPELSVSQLEIEAASARVTQAGLRPNPEITAEAENLSTPVVGAGVFQYTESTLQFSQRLEMGGKRDLRVRAAQKDVAVASRQLDTKKVELIAIASHAFAEVLAEQERAANQRELSRLAQQSYSAVVERVAAGKVSPVEQTRAAVALASAELEEEKHLQALVAAKDRLAALWGGSHREVPAVQAAFEIPPVPSDLPPSCIANNPDLKLAAAAVDSRSAALTLELAARKPDLTFSAGFRRLNLDHEEVWVAGVSIPLPIFDKRQGAIAEAKVRLEKSRAEEKTVEWRIRADLAQAQHDHAIASLEAKALSANALPAAKDAEAAVEEGYRLGKFDFLNVLDAQRTYAELQGRYIEAVASGLQAAITIQRLVRCDSVPMPSYPAK